MHWKSTLSTAALLLAAASTLVPAKASKPNLLGYYSHCSFVPWSTVILVVAGTCTYFFFEWRAQK